MAPLSALAISALIQLFEVYRLTSDPGHAIGGRMTYTLGATPELFLRILALQVYVNAILGGTMLAPYDSSRYLILDGIIVFLNGDRDLHS